MSGSPYNVYNEGSKDNTSTASTSAHGKGYARAQRAVARASGRSVRVAGAPRADCRARSPPSCAGAPLRATLVNKVISRGDPQILIGYI